MDSAGFRAKFLERALIEWHAEQLTKLEATAAQRRGVLAKVKEEASRVEAARRKEEQAATKLYRKDVAARQAIAAEAEERQVRRWPREGGLWAVGCALVSARQDQAGPYISPAAPCSCSHC